MAFSWLRVVALILLVTHCCSGSAFAEQSDGYSVTTVSEAPGLAGLALENSALGSDGQIFYTDHVSHVIRSFDLATGEVSLVAGVEGNSGHQDGDLATALLFQPRGACLSPCDGHLYFVDGGGATLRQIDFQKRTVLTVAGSPVKKGFHDGTGPDARFSVARAPVCLTNGSIVVADSSSHPAIRMVNPPTGTQCASQPPTPRPAPGPPSSTSADMLVHKVVLVGACSVLAIIAAYMFVKVHGAAWLHQRIQDMRARHAGPPRSSYPDMQELPSDEEQGASLRTPLYLTAAAADEQAPLSQPAPSPQLDPTEETGPLISFSPPIPSSPAAAAGPSAAGTPFASAAGAASMAQHPAFASPAGSSTVSSRSSSPSPTIPTQAAIKHGTHPPADAFADLI